MTDLHELRRGAALGKVLLVSLLHLPCVLRGGGAAELPRLLPHTSRYVHVDGLAVGVDPLVKLRSL